MTHEAIDVAITFDVERDPTIRAVMPEIAGLFERHNAVGTWFLKHDYSDHYTEYTGSVVEEFPGIVNRLADVGEIGTHVHFRDVDGTFSMTPDFQRDLIERATEALRSRGYPARSFRGGNLAADTTTLGILSDLAYAVDSSVLPGHYRELPDDVVVDHRGDAGNMPYRPARDAHTKRGDLAILEVPVSSLLPVESVSMDRSLTGVYNRLAVRKPLDRVLPWLLYSWGRTGGAPVVLLFHDHDFGVDDGSLAGLDRFVRAVSRSGRLRFATMQDIADGRTTAP